MLPGLMLSPGIIGSAGGNDAHTILLLHMNGADASTTFTDSSSNATTVTANGNAQLDTAQYKFGVASYLGDGSGDYLSATAAAAPGTGAFTLDFWVRYSATSGMLWNSRTSGTGTNGFDLEYDLRMGVGGAALTGGWSPSTGVWYHIAIVREGTGSNQTKSYVNGVQHEAGTCSDNFTGLNLRIGGSNYGNIGYLNGWMDEVRYSNVARWTSNFTPLSSPYA